MPLPYQEVNSTAWQQYQKDLSTTQLLMPVGSAIEMALALQKDYSIDKVRYAIKAKFPSLAPPDALYQLGVERNLPQGFTETVSAYSARLRDAWNLWKYAGTAFGLLRAFFLTGYTNVTLAQVVAGNQYTLDGTGTTLLTTTNGKWVPLSSVGPFYTWGAPSLVWGAPGIWGISFWSSFDVIFPQPLISSWVSGGVPTSSSNEANFIRSLISSWKPAHALCNRIIIITSGKIWGYPAAQNWGAGTGNWGGTTTVWSP